MGGLNSWILASMHLEMPHGFVGKNLDPTALGALDESFVAASLLYSLGYSPPGIGSGAWQFPDSKFSTDWTHEQQLAALDKIGVKGECNQFIYWRYCFRGTTLANERASRAAVNFTTKFVYDPEGVIKSLKNAANSAVKHASNDMPRDFHAAGGADVLMEPTMTALVVRSPLLFARKFGKTSGSLVYDLSESAWHGSPFSLPDLWTKADLANAETTRGPRYLDTGDEEVLSQIKEWEPELGTWEKARRFFG